MSTQVCLSVIGTLSDEPQQQAAELQKLATAWAVFVGALKELPIKHGVAIAPSTEERTPRRRRGRPRLTVAPPPSAA